MGELSPGDFGHAAAGACRGQEGPPAAAGGTNPSTRVDKVSRPGGAGGSWEWAGREVKKQQEINSVWRQEINSELREARPTDLNQTPFSVPFLSPPPLPAVVSPTLPCSFYVTTLDTGACCQCHHPSHHWSVSGVCHSVWGRALDLPMGTGV